MSLLNDFLDHCYSTTSMQEADVVNIVLGNEACDLDSVVSALCYALLLTRETGVVTLPVLNIGSEDFPLRTEVVFLLKKLGIDHTKLLFRDNISLNALKDTVQLQLYLVDHNMLQEVDKELEELVVGVVDHHKLERKNSKAEVLVEPVGSCCTLIAEKLFDLKPDLLDRTIATLLYGTILLDTINLSVEAKRATERDITIAKKLSSLCGDHSADHLYEELLAAKKDTSHLTVVQLLRKDLKVIHTNSLSVALSSVPSLARDFLKRDNVSKHLVEFVNDNYSAAVVLGIDTTNPVPKRDLAVYCSTPYLQSELQRILEGCDPDLLLSQTSASPSPNIIHYNQGNATASRKVILPHIKSALKNLRGANGNLTGQAAANRNVEMYHGAVLGGDPGSSQDSSSYNSGPYTPQNSCTDDGDASSGIGSASGRTYCDPVLPSFNSRDMMQKIESKRILLGSTEGNDDETLLLAYPFTPKNSYVESSFEQSYQQFSLQTMDVDAVAEKLRGKQFLDD